VSRERAVAEISAKRCAIGTTTFGLQRGLGPLIPKESGEAMHHIDGAVRPAADGRAQGSRARDCLTVILAAWLSLLAAGFSDLDVNVRGLFRIGASGELHLGIGLALGADTGLTSAPRGGLQFDEGDAERQVSRERAVAEISAKRCAIGTASISQCGGSTLPDNLRGRIA
jgi:hypothetical protein